MRPQEEAPYPALRPDVGNTACFDVGRGGEWAKKSERKRNPVNVNQLKLEPATSHSHAHTSGDQILSLWSTH